MSFFSNPFSSKRRREVQELEILDLDTSNQLAPETPPTAANNIDLQNRRPTTSNDSSFSSSPLLANSCEQDPETAIKVSARAQYFESLIRSKAPGAASPISDDGNYDGLKILAKSPRPAQNGGAELFGGLTAAAAADAFQNLRLELTRVDEERVKTVEALRRKTQEVENLQKVVRELTESRAAALSARATLAEQYVDLSRAHERVTRVADLSRAVSKENLELTRNARGIAAEASKEAAEARKEALMAVKAENKAAEENAVLRQQVNVLERIVTLKSDSNKLMMHSTPFAGELGCRPEFTLPIETY